jgi:hypothetical protein
MPDKPKSNRKPGSMDNCQTPSYAVQPLLPYLRKAGIRTVWEPAYGEGLLSRVLTNDGFNVTGTDTLFGSQYDFFDYDLAIHRHYDAIVTNPPFSLKYEWLQRCYELGKPFALLLPVETLGSVKGGDLFALNGIDVMMLRPRVDFKMPEAGWSGSGAQFPVAWFCHNLFLPKALMFVRVNKKDLQYE